MWPFKKKLARPKAKKRRTKKSVKAVPLGKPMPIPEAAEAVKRIAEVLTKKRPPCPEKHKLTQICACITCQNLGSCAVEKNCRSTGCETFIATCSRKAAMEREDGVSDFGEFMATLNTHKLIKSLIDEDKNPIEAKTKKKKILLAQTRKIERKAIEINEEPTVLG